jgi:hypothetical protein
MTLHPIGPKCLCVLILFAVIAGPAQARGWDCRYEGGGSNGARYVTRFEWRGFELIEPHWPNSTAYRIVTDNRDMLIAVHADAGSTYRHARHTSVTVVVLDKETGRMRRSTAESADDFDRVEFGKCARY